LLIVTARTLAQTTAPSIPEELGPMPRGNANAKEWNARGWATAGVVVERLSADDSSETRQAELARIKMLLRARPAFVTKNGTMLGLLLYKKMNADLVEVADYGITCHPGQTDDVAQLQKYKAKALAALGRRDDGLAAAKAYFNVAPMNRTADALKLLTEMLATTDAADRVETFKAEQIAGAEPVPADKLKEPRPRTAVLESIKIDASPYDKALAEQLPRSYANLASCGNLLLLADRTREAMETFESAQTLASDKEAAWATENIARAMRAVDGSIGRANAWVESLDK
jgi:tetratricopeptide (TPR) repeat protein